LMHANLADGPSGVDPAFSVVGIPSSRPEVLGGVLHPLSNLGGGEPLGSEQPGEGRHEGGGEADL